ncbi:MAG: GNAT family N-acetyltransferase [Candidatus Dormibacteria bacterium]
MAVVPLEESEARPGVWALGGGTDLSDHLGYLTLDGLELEVAAAVLEALFHDSGGERPAELDLHYLPGGAPTLEALRQAAEAAELKSELAQEEVSPRVELPSSFDDFVAASLGKRDRHELRRKLRRLSQERPGWRLISHDEMGLEPALDHFFPLLKASGAHKVQFLTDEVAGFIRAVCRRLDQRGWLRLQFLEIQGQLAATTLGFTVDRTWNLYNSGYLPELGALSPGLICVAEGIRAAIAEGCLVADFLRGNEPYKYHLGAEDRPLWRLRLAAPRDAGTWAG